MISAACFAAQLLTAMAVFKLPLENINMAGELGNVFIAASLLEPIPWAVNTALIKNTKHKLTTLPCPENFGKGSICRCIPGLLPRAVPKPDGLFQLMKKPFLLKIFEDKGQWYRLRQSGSAQG